MGGHFYHYIVDYQPDVDAALQQLREREFRAGRYYPVLRYPEQFLAGPTPPSPGAGHRSIRDALKASAETGTRSILDLERVSARPEYGAVTPLADDVLLRHYGTTRPTREMVEDFAFAEDMEERGQGVYVVLYRDGRPDAILFAGYSFD